MSALSILIVFIVLRLVQHLAERLLARINRRYWEDPVRRSEAQRVLGMSDEDMQRTLAYSEDKYRFAAVAGWVNLVVLLVFIAAGGLGLLEAWASRGGVIVTGLLFFAALGLAGMLLGLPFEYYRTFVLEQKHGFNRQTPKGFWLDRLKGLVLAVVLGGPLLALLLWIMARAGQLWWIYAWGAMTAFSLLTAWLYPTFLAPLFNKFKPVEGELAERVHDLARRIGFRTAGIYVMDASTRSSHGNAYFTGVFGKKRIVLFDTLVQAMSAPEVVAVLAHELGHFKLHHIRWSLIRGTLMTGVTFWLLSLCLPLTPFYEAFHLNGVSSYGALVVFGLWFGVVDFLLQPFTNYVSRRNEFAADQFAKVHSGGAAELGTALLKLRETSHAMPISHPVFSSVYYSHPPLIERLAALGYTSTP